MLNLNSDTDHDHGIPGLRLAAGYMVTTTNDYTTTIPFLLLHMTATRHLNDDKPRQKKKKKIGTSHALSCKGRHHTPAPFPPEPPWRERDDWSRAIIAN